MKNAENSSDFAFLVNIGPPNWEVDEELYRRIQNAECSLSMCDVCFGFGCVVVSEEAGKYERAHSERQHCSSTLYQSLFLYLD